MASRRTASLVAAVLVTAALGVTVLAFAQGGGAAPPAAAPAATPPGPPPSTVKIVFITVPMKKAFVSWGKRRLGMIAPHAPLVVERPRDSGPLDVVVRADGYIPVQTRAYTFADNKVAVKLTPPDQKKTLLGYREEVPAADGGVEPGSAPPSAASMGGPDGGAR